MHCGAASVHLVSRIQELMFPKPRKLYYLAHLFKNLRLAMLLWNVSFA